MTGGCITLVIGVIFTTVGIVWQQDITLCAGFLCAIFGVSYILKERRDYDR
jgi:1,4-dihydroxy-2-naphthoate octaprenyltransferase